MSSSDIALVLRWIVPLWLLGWAAFPVSRRLFSFLPDQGLALGRVLTIVLGSLGAFWLASVHALPLSVGVCLVPALAVASALRWRDAEPKKAVREHLAALIFSDCVFLLAFLFFVWVRLRHPSINDLEKPMDLALLNQSSRAQLLPFEHFWFAGVSFTNYYFFGPFLGGTLARLFATPAPFAYNLVQPLFCALFLSVLWSLGAALSKSKWLGLGVMALVGLGGHLEPLRQLFVDKKLFGELDWFQTSRVIERVPSPSGAGFDYHTINEYPAFTLLIGDAHAHFYAFALAVSHFCLCLGIVCVESKSAKQVLIVLGGVMLGAIAITNTWDVPLYGVLWGLCVLNAHRKDENTRATRDAALIGLALTVIVALPFFARFRSQVGGGGFMLWLPDAFGFALFWGVWIALGVFAFGRKTAPSRDGNFRRLLLLVGILALLFPSIYTIGGAFAGSDYKHQDTVFKFYLQAWLLGGTAISSAFFLRLHGSTKGRVVLQIPAWAGVLALTGVLSLAPYVTWRARTQGYGEEGLSLDGAKWLPQSDRKAIEWLREQNGTVAEALPPDKGGDYDANRGTLATQSGVPGVLCWPNSHVRPWGFQNDATRAAAQHARETGVDVKQAQTDAMNAQVDERTRDLSAIYGGDIQTRHALVKKHRISFIVVRPDAPPIVDPGFESHEFDGDDDSKTFVLERKGF